jgi:hypothetical protein
MISDNVTEIIKYFLTIVGSLLTGWLVSSLRKVSPRQLDEKLVPLHKDLQAINQRLQILEQHSDERFDQMRQQYVTQREQTGVLQGIGQRITDINDQLSELRSLINHSKYP